MTASVRAGRCDARCYVCNRVVKTYEMDHFPVPERLGGGQVLPICRDCHDYKDRHPLDTWGLESAFEGLAGLWGKASREERLLLVKMFHVVSNPQLMNREERRDGKA